MLAAVAIVSAGALAYEVLLTRLMAIVHWHHFAAIVISMALLGYGASDSALAALGGKLDRHRHAAFAASATLFGLTALAGFLLAQRVPFNALEVIWDPRQIQHLLTLYLLFLVPFFFAAACVGLAYAGLQVHAGRVYAFDLLGAGAGAVLVVLALDHQPPLAVLGLVAATGPLAAALALRRAAALVPVAAAAGLALLPATGLLELRMSPYKGLSQALQLPGAKVEAERSSSLGLLQAVRSGAVPFRHVPGLSLMAPQEPAEQRGIFVDGEGPMPLTRFTGNPAPLAYFGYTTGALAYELLDRPRALILGGGGGTDVVAALLAGAVSVDVVELDPELVRLVGEDYRAFTGDLYGRPEVRIHVAEPRRFLAGSTQRWDLIRLPPLDVGGAAGRIGLHETYGYTVEALEGALEQLSPEGVLSVTGWLRLPPRDTLKLVLSAILALEREGVTEAGRHLVVLRSWDTVTVIVKRSPLTVGEIGAVRAFAGSRGFDLDHVPGLTAGGNETGFHSLAGSPLREGTEALLGPGRDAFLAAYKFDLRPATDDRPYFFDFLRWRTLPEILAAGRQGNAALVDWGYLVQLAGFAITSVLAAVLILLPLRLGLPGVVGGRGGVALFFLLIGAAFMMVEIAAIQRLVLFLGHPVHAVAAALAAFLVFAGLGGRLAARLDRGAASAPALAASATGLLAASYALLLPGLLAVLDDAAGAMRFAAAVLAVAPLAVLMGTPFPLALARVKATAPGLVPWAWGINGCAAVVATMVATLLAVHIGLAMLMLLAAAGYLAAAFAARASAAEHPEPA